MRHLLILAFAIGLTTTALLAADDDPDEPTSSSPSALPVKTSRYNRGDFPGRYRDAAKKVRLFELKRGETPVCDGAGREIGKATKPMMLNIGAAKSMDIDGNGVEEKYAWAWRTEAGSGWIDRAALVDPPPPDVDPQRDPKPPRE